MTETFPYEQLDGARFQRLAQCLIVKEYKEVQCLPLSGADDGRGRSPVDSRGPKAQETQ